jgi:hypothetical protein
MGMIGMSEQSPPQRVSFRKNSSQHYNQKTVLLLLEMYGYKTFVK